jgi:hypothetical protein
MQSLIGKITGDSLTAAEWNQLPTEVQNVITGLGISLSSGDLNQLGKAIAGYVANGEFYTDSGAADAYVLSAIGSKQAPPAYTDGMRVRFAPANSNTGASTVNVAGLGVKSIKTAAGADPAAGILQASTWIQVVYDNAAGYFVIDTVGQSQYSADPILWPTIANNTTDANNDIDFSTGAIADSTGEYLLENGSTLVKQLDAAWAVGTNAGGLFSGTKAINTTYHCFLIRKDSDGSIDAGYDTSVSAANIPAGYTAYRRIGSILTDGSGNILAFTQVRDHFFLGATSYDVNTLNPGTSAITLTLTIPTGLNIRALFNLYLDSGSAAPVFGYVSSPHSPDETPSGAGAPMCNLLSYTSSDFTAHLFDIMTNTSGQVRYRLSSSASDTSVRGATLGWIDDRS